MFFTSLALVPALALAGSLDNPAQGGFGAALATGDVDGDGYADLVVGAPRFHGRGAAYLFRGGPAGPSAPASWVFDCPQRDTDCASTLALMDVDQDGYDDLLLGAQEFGGVAHPEGRVFVIPGGPGGLGPTATSVLQGPVGADALFGSAIAPVGDVNGDGFPDLVVGASDFSGNVPFEGAILVFLGAGAGLATPAAQLLQDGNRNQAYFGRSVAGVGDVNGDGFDDVLVGAPEYDTALNSAGAAFLYEGSAAGLGPVAWSARGDQAFGFWGEVVAGAGDVNGDGFADMIVATNTYDMPAGNEGRVDLYFGSAIGPAAVPDQTMYGAAFAAAFGGSVVALGDTNGDGFDDVLIGQGSNADPCAAGAGIYLGSAVGLDPAPASSLNDCTLRNGGTIGWTAAAGDLDGNGAIDFAVGGGINVVDFQLY